MKQTMMILLKKLNDFNNCIELFRKTQSREMKLEDTK